MKNELHIGFDDTDSLKGSCTTHLATTIVHEIFDQVDFLDFPSLIRLNPNVPHKTRGNGAVALRIKGEDKDLESVRELVIKTVKNMARLDDENTNPGIAFLTNAIPREIRQLSLRAMWDVISIPEAEKFNSFSNVDLIKLGNGRGIIGALGAIGNLMDDDFTYEHLSYRLPENFGTKRKVDRESILIADKATPLTFSNVDYEYNSVMITPRGADPVFSGIRGETPEEVMKAWSLVKPLEEIAMLMVYRTNQHTNQHFLKHFVIEQLKPHRSVIVQGVVSKTPHYIEGSHLIFSIKDDTGEVDCAAYEPTKRFRGELSNLAIGDNITVFGGIRPAEEKHPMTINVERLRVDSLVKVICYENPFCDNCNARLKSAGKNKGFKCQKCSTVYRDKKQIEKELPRNISLKEYLPPIIAHRHLTKPIERENQNNKNKQIRKSEVKRIMKLLLDFKNES
jgi:tRNA(Ile2)-agmatinylcytidine synthase